MNQLFKNLLSVIIPMGFVIILTVVVADITPATIICWCISFVVIMILVAIIDYLDRKTKKEIKQLIEDIKANRE